MFNTVIFLLTMSHLKAVVTDPGTVPLDNTDQEKDHLHADFSGCDWTMCTRCDTYRPPRAHHCRICQRCIKRMDHHCPWINNCVGERNQKYFIQFLIYVGMVTLLTHLGNFTNKGPFRNFVCLCYCFSGGFLVDRM